MRPTGPCFPGIFSGGGGHYGVGSFGGGTCRHGRSSSTYHDVNVVVVVVDVDVVVVQIVAMVASKVYGNEKNQEVPWRSDAYS